MPERTTDKDLDLLFEGDWLELEGSPRDAAKFIENLLFARYANTYHPISIGRNISNIELNFKKIFDGSLKEDQSHFENYSIRFLEPAITAKNEGIIDSVDYEIKTHMHPRFQHKGVDGEYSLRFKTIVERKRRGAVGERLKIIRGSIDPSYENHPLSQVLSLEEDNWSPENHICHISPGDEYYVIKTRVINSSLKNSKKRAEQGKSESIERWVEFRRDALLNVFSGGLPSLGKKR